MRINGLDESFLTSSEEVPSLEKRFPIIQWSYEELLQRQGGEEQELRGRERSSGGSWPGPELDHRLRALINLWELTSSELQFPKVTRV